MPYTDCVSPAPFVDSGPGLVRKIQGSFLSSTTDKSPYLVVILILKEGSRIDCTNRRGIGAIPTPLKQLAPVHLCSLHNPCEGQIIEKTGFRGDH